jgi:signal transduction histidine kinase
LHVDLSAAQHQQRLEVAQRAVTQANRLIDDLLDAALLEAGQITVKPERTDVHQILATVADQTRPLVEINELALQIRPADDLPPVLADPTRLIQILQNLIGNAVKVMREGTITVTAHHDQDAATVVFRVQDMGPGIPESEQKAVFTRYWRGSNSPRRSAGLGLAIAQGLVERHGGRIWVEGVDGAGAAFVFTLPVSAP